MARLHYLLVAANLLLSFSGSAQADPEAIAALEGYVTNYDSPLSFQINGTQVRFTKNARMGVQEFGPHNTLQVNYSDNVQPYFGEPAKVFGKLDRKKHTVTATQIVFYPVEGDVAGIAIIDLIPPAPTSDSIIVRADGYHLLLDQNTQLKSTPAHLSIHDLHTNTWIAYHGKRSAAGIILVDKASTWPNSVNKSEDKALAKTDYDPMQIDQDAHQSGINKFIRGFDPKLVPPYLDLPTQARVERIGNSLIPAYQRALSESDPNRIEFRFELVDMEGWHDALTLPSGVILIPVQVVEQLTSDTQLATVLADNIACALEMQSLKLIPIGQEMNVAQIIGTVGGFIIPGLGVATAITNASIAKTLARHAVEQSGRVSLTLLADAGYDIHLAPETWWRLYSKSATVLADGPLPPRAAYLYQAVGVIARAPVSSLSSVSDTGSAGPTP